jgi:hypothetical protein
MIDIIYYLVFFIVITGLYWILQYIVFSIIADIVSFGSITKQKLESNKKQKVGFN